MGVSSGFPWGPGFNRRLGNGERADNKRISKNVRAATVEEWKRAHGNDIIYCDAMKLTWHRNQCKLLRRTLRGKKEDTSIEARLYCKHCKTFYKLSSGIERKVVKR